MNRGRQGRVGRMVVLRAGIEKKEGHESWLAECHFVKRRPGLKNEGM